MKDVLVLFSPPRYDPLMPSMTPAFVHVPFDEVAAVLSEAVKRTTGGPARVIPAQGDYLASAIYQAGLEVVRQAAPSQQLTMEGL